MIIIALTSIVSIRAFNSPELVNRWIFDPYIVVREREYHRFITAGFLHGSWTHLIVNMLVLFFFGGVVEQYYSAVFGAKAPVYFILLYFSALAVANLPSYKKHQNDHSYRSLGASGAVSAVVFASIVFQPLENIYIWGVLPVPGIILGALYLYYSARMSKRSSDNIDHDAHFYGAVFGFAFTIVMKPALLQHFLGQLSGWF